MINSIQCDCGGTAPGYPQHESFCPLSRAVRPDEDHDRDQLAARVNDDPWEDAVVDDSLPFE